MKIETKYNIGDYIEYVHTSRTVGGKESKETRIGIIKSISLHSVKDGTKIVYYGTGFPGGVGQNDILALLGPIA